MPPPCLVSEPCNCIPCQDLQEANTHLREALERQRLAMAKANKYHDPFTNRLSPEVVSQIFQHCLPSPGYVDDLPSDYWTSFDNDIVQGSFTPLLFGAVCQHWRRIAWSTPRLWWLLSVNLHGSFDDKRLRLSREWLDRSGKLPLTVIVDTRDRNPDLGRPKGINTRITSSFMTMLSQYVHRASTLCFFVPTCGLLRLQPERVFESQFKSLVIVDVSEAAASVLHRFSGTPMEKLCFTSANTPSPQKLYISGFGVENVGIGWSSLTEISGDNIWLEEWVKIFKTATNLVRCHIVETSMTPLLAMHQKRVVHSNLQSLQVGSSPHTIWKLFSFPALNSLCTCRSRTGDADHLGDTDMIQSFLSTSGCSLKKLDIQFWEDAAEIFNFLYPHVELEELILYQHLPEDFMRYLGDTTRPTDTSGMDQPVKFLPKLRRFVYEGGYKTFGWPSISYMLTGADDISDLVCERTSTLKKPRRRLQDVQFNLHLHTSRSTSQDSDEIDQESVFLLEYVLQLGCSISIKYLNAGLEKADVLAEAIKKYELLVEQVMSEHSLK